MHMWLGRLRHSLVLGGRKVADVTARSDPCPRSTTKISGSLPKAVAWSLTVTGHRSRCARFWHARHYGEALFFVVPITEGMSLINNAPTPGCTQVSHCWRPIHTVP